MHFRIFKVLSTIIDIIFKSQHTTIFIRQKDLYDTFILLLVIERYSKIYTKIYDISYTYVGI